MPAAPGDVAVVTVTYRSAGEVRGFVESIRAAEELDLPIVIADNPSDETPETAGIASELGVAVVRLAENVGYGAAVNAASRTLGPETSYVLISNPDVRVHPGAISRLRETFVDRPDAGAVGPRVLNEDGTTYPSARQIPSLRTGVGHALFSRLWPANPWTRRYREEAWPADESRDVGWLSGSCLLVRRESFEAVGGFDGRYFMYFEDVDLGFRLGKAGWANVYEPSATVTHVGATSTTTARSQMLRAHHRSAQRFLDRKYSAWYVAPVRWGVHVGLDLRAWWLTRS